MNEITLRTPAAETETAADASHDEMMAECVRVESEKRKWLQAITKFLALRSHEGDPSSAVQTASDLASIAAYDRVARMLRSDDAME